MANDRESMAIQFKAFFFSLLTMSNSIQLPSLEIQVNGFEKH